MNTILQTKAINFCSLSQLLVLTINLPLSCGSCHTKSKMPSVCKSDVLLSPFPDALMLWHLLHWNSQSIIRANAERGASGSGWGPQVQGGGLILPGNWGRGVGGNLMGAPKFYDTGPRGPHLRGPGLRRQRFVSETVRGRL